MFQVGFETDGKVFFTTHANGSGYEKRGAVGGDMRRRVNDGTRYKKRVAMILDTRGR